MTMTNDKILEVSNLQKYFPIKMGAIPRVVGYIRAVDGVSFSVKRGEVLGIVGESGCGKSTLARTILRLLEPTGGKIVYKGVDITKMKKKELRKYRKWMQMVFQDPYTQLNPRMNIKGNIGIAIKQHFKISGKEVEERVGDLLESVGLNRKWMYRYPHEFSGGQLQRIAIARALSVQPEFLVLDEPTSALDVSVQAQILNMLKELQKDKGLTYLFISHDLGVVKYMSNRIAVMYIGKIVEMAKADELFENPLHPYTKMLMAALPIPDPKITRSKKRMKVVGEPPSPINVPPGCRFWPRCPYANTKCRIHEPPLIEVEKDHYVACWLYE